ncbi:MAG: hypothetical protein J0J01_12470 [Reyranella sp.]|uniref:hypothetical protein n=1 Tax=Reyranella sp. TaxID=1929291 RepID=UPI001AC603C2|nr:hypothetical protein [Reyranella sp.]MBN9087715.1 hypothetical protein [Reyranella sp.]
MDHAEIVIAARRARARTMHRWMKVLSRAVRVWIAARVLELEQRTGNSAATTASWPWWRT